MDRSAVSARGGDEAPAIGSTVVWCRGDDGSTREFRVTPRWAKIIAAMEEYDAKKEKRYQARTTLATDCRVNLNNAPDRRTLLQKEGVWEGPRYNFNLFLGSGHPWSGLGTHEVEVEVENADGLVIRRKRCRGCGHYLLMPKNAYCLYCDRSGEDPRIPKRGRKLWSKKVHKIDPSAKP